MAVLKQELAADLKSSVAGNKSWYRLCYDVDKAHFFVEHEWRNDNPVCHPYAGFYYYDVNRWNGLGADMIPFAKRLLVDGAHSLKLD